MVSVPDLTRLGARRSWYGVAEVRAQEMTYSSMAHPTSLGKTVAASGICGQWPERAFRFTIGPGGDALTITATGDHHRREARPAPTSGCQSRPAATRAAATTARRYSAGMSGCSRRSPLDSCSWTPRGGSGSGPLARRGTATLVMANCTSRLAKVPRSRPLSRGRTRCPRCPASRGTTRCRHRQAVAARVPRRARPVVRIRPQVRPGALHPRARCRPARQDAAGS
jgi:hypothetical protein